MINYSAQQTLKIPIMMFFNTVKRVRNYKNFVPWCTDSWEINKITQHKNYEQIINKYPIFEKNKNVENRVKELLNRSSASEALKTQIFDGGLKAGFNIIDFSYTSHVIAIEPNIVLSIADSSKSHIFKRLESVWILNENKDALGNRNTQVEYHIDFEFKSAMYSSVTNIFLNFLGDNIMKAFINKCQSDLLNGNHKELLEGVNTESGKTDSDSTLSLQLTEEELHQFLENRLVAVYFDSPQDKINLQSLLAKLYQLRKLNLNEIDKLIKVISYNRNAMRNLAFLSEVAVWNNSIQIEKIRSEVERNFLI